MSRIYDALKRAEKDTKAVENRAGAGFSETLFHASHMDAAPESRSEGVAISQEIAEPDDRIVDAAFQPSVISPTGDWLPSRYESWQPSPNCSLFADGQRGTSVVAEQFRRLRSRLYQIRERQPVKRVLVSSAIASEGKTFLCANLAQALACHGRTRVLLIDADLRKPSLHTELGAAVAPGLADYLRGNADELAITQCGPIKNLWFISGGSSVADPADLVTSTRFQQLMDRVSKLFDWIILDSSPVVPISDATVLAQHCDGVLLVVRAGVTPFDLAQKAKEEFRNSVLLGVALNQVSEVTSYKPYYYAYQGSTSPAKPAPTTV